ncbi:DUF5703 family protein [Demequina sp. NBRC 110053]|uniref:DUF5703 family protein n=1 Tax=Demequina sp. NBRC 110053 TaxID=1570342 RepID=UPI001F240E97|nr:DUF5703 family protein [Demequina sp. NBRC 110053]
MREIGTHASHVISPSRGRSSAPSRFEWRVVDIPRDVTRSEVHAMVNEQVEYGRWELKRSQILVGGARRVWLRRRVMRVVRTDAA